MVEQATDDLRFRWAERDTGPGPAKHAVDADRRRDAFAGGCARQAIALTTIAMIITEPAAATANIAWRRCVYLRRAMRDMISNC